MGLDSFEYEQVKKISYRNIFFPVVQYNDKFYMVNIFPNPFHILFGVFHIFLPLKARILTREEEKKVKEYNENRRKLDYKMSFGIFWACSVSFSRKIQNNICPISLELGLICIIFAFIIYWIMFYIYRNKDGYQKKKYDLRIKVKFISFAKAMQCIILLAFIYFISLFWLVNVPDYINDGYLGLYDLISDIGFLFIPFFCVSLFYVEKFQIIQIETQKDEI